jgi:putative ABC transport system permease protein
VDREAPVFEASTLQALADRSAAPMRLASRVAIALAAAGLLLAIVGVYAVSAAALSERTRELGVRAALGATPRELSRLIFAEGAWSAIAGGFTGAIAASFVAASLRAQVFGVRSSDMLWLVPLVFVAVLFVLGTTVVPAARRAAAADPIVALRAE